MAGFVNPIITYFFPFHNPKEILHLTQFCVAGVAGFDNPMRDVGSEETIRQIAQVVIMMMTMNAMMIMMLKMVMMTTRMNNDLKR